MTRSSHAMPVLLNSRGRPGAGGTSPRTSSPRSWRSLGLRRPGEDDVAGLAQRAGAGLDDRRWRGRRGARRPRGRPARGSRSRPRSRGRGRRRRRTAARGRWWRRRRRRRRRPRPGRRGRRPPRARTRRCGRGRGRRRARRRRRARAMCARACGPVPNTTRRSRRSARWRTASAETAAVRTSVIADPVEQRDRRERVVVEEHVDALDPRLGVADRDELDAEAAGGRTASAAAGPAAERGGSASTSSPSRSAASSASTAARGEQHARVEVRERGHRSTNPVPIGSRGSSTKRCSPVRYAMPSTSVTTPASAVVDHARGERGADDRVVGEHGARAASARRRPAAPRAPRCPSRTASGRPRRRRRSRRCAGAGRPPCRAARRRGSSRRRPRAGRRSGAARRRWRRAPT